MNYQQDVQIFKALCDEKRLIILGLLQQGEKCACELIDETAMKQSALSYHMKILCDSGLVTARPEGKWTHYSLSTSGAQVAIKRLKILTNLNE